MPPLISESFETVFVFGEIGGKTAPAGRLDIVNKLESKFSYGKSWQERKAHSIDPVNLPVRGRAYTSTPHAMPLILYDASPDSWGKEILQAAFPLHDFRIVDFLAAAGNERTGALQTGFNPEQGPERWVPSETALIPIDSAEIQEVEALLDAAIALEEGRAGPEHLQWLLKGSGDVGGARPKARLLKDGHGWIAKFSARGDTFDDPKAEALSLDLAEACGIEVPEHEIITVMGKAVLLVKRFDRGPDGKRYDYMSAATLVGQSPGVYFSEYTYADVAIAARKAHFEPCEKEIFRRVLFYAFIHCTDDHLRNTAFIRDREWRLSPLFDVVPHKQERHATLPARDSSPKPDPTAMCASHKAFKLDQKEAVQIYDEVASGIAHLEKFMERRELTARDRGILKEMMPYAVKPPAVTL